MKCRIKLNSSSTPLKSETKGAIINKVRNGNRDVWNANMAEGATFCEHDIVLCPTTATEDPRDSVTHEEAKAIFKREIAKGNTEFFYDAFVNFYIDDYKFDGRRGIWYEPERLLEILRHFSGCITPDFSTYQDFPEPIKIYATYRMRLLGYWLGKNGIAVINNVRWGTEETYNYCFAGIPTDSIVAIGTVGGSPRKHIDRERFENGLYKMVEVLRPHTIVVYGSANYECFDVLRARGIKIISFQSKTAKAFAGRKLS